MFPYKKACMFVGGLLFGTAGVSVLKSQDAKKVYTECTAAVLRGKDAVMATGTALRENCTDIYEDAVDINEKRYRAADQKKLEEARALVAEYEKKTAEDGE